MAVLKCSALSSRLQKAWKGLLGGVPDISVLVGACGDILSIRVYSERGSYTVSVRLDFFCNRDVCVTADVRLLKLLAGSKVISVSCYDCQDKPGEFNNFCEGGMAGAGQRIVFEASGSDALVYEGSGSSLDCYHPEYLGNSGKPAFAKSVKKLFTASVGVFPSDYMLRYVGIEPCECDGVMNPYMFASTLPAMSRVLLPWDFDGMLLLNPLSFRGMLPLLEGCGTCFARYAGSGGLCLFFEGGYGIISSEIFIPSVSCQVSLGARYKSIFGCPSLRVDIERSELLGLAKQGDWVSFSVSGSVLSVISVSCSGDNEKELGRVDYPLKEEHLPSVCLLSPKMLEKALINLPSDSLFLRVLLGKDIIVLGDGKTDCEITMAGVKRR